MQLIVKLILHRNKTGLFLGPNGSEVPFATLVALFLFPTQEVTTAFVSVFIFSLHNSNGKLRTYSNDFSETSADSSTKVLRNIERFRRKVIDQFIRFDFSKMNSFEDFGPPGAQWHCVSGPPRVASGDSRKEKHCL